MTAKDTDRRRLGLALDAKSLLRQVQNGHTLSSAELHWVRKALSSESEQTDPYALIHILWKAGDVASTPLLLRAIELHSSSSDSDSMVRRIALQALAGLCSTPDVFELAATRLVSDDSAYVRMAAATIVGDLGRAIPSLRPGAARLLLDQFNLLSEHGGLVWESCYDGLLSLANVPYTLRPLATRALRPEDVDEGVLRAVAQLATAESREG